jgi:hypothetical protein
MKYIAKKTSKVKNKHETEIKHKVMEILQLENPYKAMEKQEIRNKRQVK